MISLIVPTRNRPEALERFYKSWVDTKGSGELILVTDHDDSNDYTHMDARIVIDCYGDGHRGMERPGSTVEKINAGARAAKYDIIGFSGDDVVIETDGWEEIVSEAMSLERLSLTHPIDGIKGSHATRKYIPNHIFMSRGLYETLGWFAYPKLRHPWVDYVWCKIGNYLNATGKGDYQRLNSVVFKHLHWLYFDNVKKDDTYIRAYTEDEEENSRVHYDDYTPSF